ncbi:hypothetical protein HYZ97_01445 [Candidatus Pacearchaeota archaeon]|nr:hypothetical protein [Candidatus Pacearchaeota archaeon]
MRIAMVCLAGLLVFPGGTTERAAIAQGIFITEESRAAALKEKFMALTNGWAEESVLKSSEMAAMEKIGRV